MERITKLHNMKNLTFVGIILLAIGVVLFYLNNMALDLRVVYGALCGIGVGLIFGGIVGYVSKGSAVKQENKMRQFKQLQKEKDELEKKQAQLMQDATQQEQEQQSRNVSLLDKFVENTGPVNTLNGPITSKPTITGISNLLLFAESSTEFPFASTYVALLLKFV